MKLKDMGEFGFIRSIMDNCHFGPERLIYGSNWPVCERAGSFSRGIRIVKAYWAEKGTEASDRYFWHNAKAIYRYVGPR